MSSERSGGPSPGPYPSVCVGCSQLAHSAHGPIISGMSQLHLGAELGPSVGPVHRVVADAEEPLGEAQGGQQQGDAQEEQHPLAHTGLLLL